MALKPFNSPGGFSVGELTTGVVNVVTSTGNVITGNILPSTGAANVGNLNILAGNVVVAGGAGYVYANGYYLNNIQYSNIVGAYGNANVANYLASNANIAITTLGNITTQGNIQGNYILGNGALLTGLYGNADVTNYLASNANVTITIGTGNITTQGTITGAGLISTGNITATGNISGGNIVGSGNITGANLISTGNITATGNISAGNFVGSGTNTTIAADSYDWIFDNTGNLTLPGNTWNVYYANGQVVSLYGNSNVASYLSTGISSNIITTGNVSGGYILGNGAFLTGLPAQYSNANVANYLPVYGGALLTNNITNTGNVVIQGNLQVLGTETIINTTVLSVADINIVVANGAPNPAAANGAGIMVGNSGNSYTDITWSNPANVWTLNSNGIVTYGNVDAGTNYILGNGAFLTGLPATYGNANVAAYLASNANIDINIGGNVSANNYTGQGANVELVIGSNVWTFDANLTLPGNAWNVRYANGTLVPLGGTYSNADVASYLASGALTSNIITSGNVQSQNIINSGAIFSLGRINSDDSITGKEFVSNGFIQASGVITTSANIVGNNISANTNISAGANITAAGNVYSNGLYNTGNLINTGAIYATGRINADDSLTAKEITSNGFIQASGIISTSANIIAGNILANTNVIATGNVVGTYILGNGAFLTGLPAGYSNADVANYLASNANVTIVTQGNITTQGAVNAAVFNGTTSNIELQAGSNTWVLDQTGNLTLPTNTWQVNYANGTPVSLSGNYSNATVASYLASGTLNSNIITSANVQSGNIINSGAIFSLGRINTDDSLTAKEITSNGFIQASGVITTSGNIVANNATINSLATIATLTVTGDAAILGNLRVDGNTTFINANTLNIGDKNIVLANGAATASDANGGGIQLGNVGANGFTEIYWVSTSNTWVFNSNAISTQGNVSANYLLGNGAFITGLPAGYANSNVKSFLNTANSGLNFVTSGGGYVEMQGTEFGAVRAAGYFETTASTSLANLAVIPVSTLSSGTRALEATIRGELDGNTQVGKLIVTWETQGNTSDYSRYGEVILGAGCGIPSATFDGTNVLIQVTPRVATSTDWTVSVTSL